MLGELLDGVDELAFEVLVEFDEEVQLRAEVFEGVLAELVVALADGVVLLVEGVVGLVGLLFEGVERLVDGVTQVVERRGATRDGFGGVQRGVHRLPRESERLPLDVALGVDAAVDGVAHLAGQRHHVLDDVFGLSNRVAL